MNVYLDNAATTPLHPEVWTAMSVYLTAHFGNPSSTHSFGRKAKNAIESSRREIAKELGVQPAQIIFTGSGTEGNNTILKGAVANGINHIISSPIEHHAVLHTIEDLVQNNSLKVSWIDLNEDGSVNLESLDKILKQHPEDRKLVSLMHVNNEIGTILPIEKVGTICKNHNTLFHSDTVQSIGTIPFNLNDAFIDFATCSAHKFHGPKGVGFMFVKDLNFFKSLLHGGSQERGHRAGTENVASIVGMSTALSIVSQNLDANYQHMQNLKNHFINEVQQIDKNITVVGGVSNDASPKILNLCFPETLVDDMFLFNLDLKGIAASGGSACSSGSNQGSHVISQVRNLENCRAVRFSFSKYNTLEEIDYTIQQIKEIVKS